MSESPISPEDEGIPKYADDTSSAYDLGDRPSFEDSPAALPAEEPALLPPEEIGPEEEADFSERPGDADAASLDHERYVESESGIEVTEDDESGVIVDVEPVDMTIAADDGNPPAEDADITMPDAAVTLYDVDEPGDPVGRLVEDGPGATASDSGEIEGLSPEEAAMRTVD